MPVLSRISAYRVQAADGRGPWRPGWSHTWIDADAPADRLVETVLDLVSPDVLMALPSTMMYGCACRSLGDLMRWFTPLERHRLQAVGFYPVRLMADVVLAESQWQILIGRTTPFAQGATRYRWSFT